MPRAQASRADRVCQLAAAHDFRDLPHVAYMSRIDPESAAELYPPDRLCRPTGAHMRTSTSTLPQDGRGSLRRAGCQAQAQGLPITVEAYPYGTGSTVLAAAFFSDPDSRRAMGWATIRCSA